MQRYLAGALNLRQWIGLAAAVLAIASGPGLAQVVPGTSNPYLSGMPNGSTCCSGDSAPAQSPVPVTGIAITPGTLLTFSATGSVTFDSSTPPSMPPDGGSIFTTVSTNGISGGTWPENSLVAVFLDSSQPDASPAPAALNFSGAGVGTSFATLSPALKQAFFIGDGRTGAGAGAVQTFVVPAGATRLFLGVTDGFGWFNNAGSFSVTVAIAGPPPAAASAAEIPVLAPWLLVLLSAVIGASALWRRRS